jgi:mannosyltransferase OCH1-like enzyme
MLIHLLAPKDQTLWPKIWYKCYDIWKTSPYKIKMWYDEDIDQLLKEDDKEFFNSYLSKLDKIYKFDYVRYLILEKFGGAYFDMDIEIVRDFIFLLNKDVVYIMEGNRDEYLQNSIMISPPNNRLWTNIKYYCKWNVINHFEKCRSSNFWTVNTVGPLALSSYFSKFKPPFEMLSYHHFSTTTNTLSFSKHHNTISWVVL